MLEFILGFVFAFVSVITLLIYAGGQVKPVLGKRLKELESERREKHARALRSMTGKVDGRKISTIDTVRFQSTPAHISSAGAPCRMTMFGTAVTLATAHQFEATQDAKGNDDGRSPVAKKQDRVLCTLNSKNLHARLDPSDRNAIILEPRTAGEYVAEVDDERTVDGAKETVRCKWRSLKIMFVHGGAREAERWLTVMNPSATTERWSKWCKSIPEKHEGCFNMLLARILFENSSTSTLDDFIAEKVRKKLAHVKLPKPLMGELKLVYVHFGDEAPFFTNTDFAGFSPHGEFCFNFDLLYRGGFQLSLAATVEFMGFTIPTVIVDLLIREVRGRAQVSIGGPPSNKMWIGFHEPPDLTIELHQDVQVPEKLQFLSQGIKALDLSGIVSDVVKTQLFADMILPLMDDIPIPDVGPQSPLTPRDDEQREDCVPPVLTGWDRDADRPMWDKDHQTKIEATIGVQATPGTDSKRIQADLSKHMHSGEEVSASASVSQESIPKSAAISPSSKSKSPSRSKNTTPRAEGDVGHEEAVSGVRRVAQDVKHKLQELLHKRRTEGGSGSGRNSKTTSPQPEATPADDSEKPAIVSGGDAVAQVPHPSHKTTAQESSVASNAAVTMDPKALEERKQLTDLTAGSGARHGNDDTSGGSGTTTNSSGGRSPTHEWVKDMSAADVPPGKAVLVPVATSKSSAGPTSTTGFTSSSQPPPSVARTNNPNQSTESPNPQSVSHDSELVPEHQQQQAGKKKGTGDRQEESTSSADVVSTPNSGRRPAAGAAPAPLPAASTSTPPPAAPPPSMAGSSGSSAAVPQGSQSQEYMRPKMSHSQPQW